MGNKKSKIEKAELIDKIKTPWIEMMFEDKPISEIPLFKKSIITINKVELKLLRSPKGNLYNIPIMQGKLLYVVIATLVKPMKIKISGKSFNWYIFLSLHIRQDHYLLLYRGMKSIHPLMLNYIFTLVGGKSSKKDLRKTLKFKETICQKLRENTECLYSYPWKIISNCTPSYVKYGPYLENIWYNYQVFGDEDEGAKKCVLHNKLHGWAYKCGPRHQKNNEEK